MKIEKLGIEGVWLGRSAILADNRGNFREWFKSTEISEMTGKEFKVEQSNTSTSKKGVIRGIHYSLAQKGQGKWITCISGSIWDVVVDIRPSSPTYKKWIGMELSANEGTSILISEGLGHAFLSLEDNSVVSYLLTTQYSPSEEFEINPLDPELGISWPGSSNFMSVKDSSAPDLQTRYQQGNLPN
jgi:dTDP-4-dehydrorhamnose 3,5-epimerase